MRSRTLALLVLLLFLSLVATARTETDFLAGQLICLDPGHGGADPGAVNGDLYEKNINLDVAYALRSLLQADGAEVIMTRPGDEYLENRDRYTFCNENSATLLVSVHTNSVVDTSMDGAMTLYFKSEDKVLARAIQDIMWPMLRDTAPVDPDDFRDFGLSRFASGVLMKSDMPAAMVEPLFMSNAAEAPLLQTTIHQVSVDGVVTLTDGEPILNQDCADCRRLQIAQAVHQGVLSYVVPDVPPTGAMHVASIDLWTAKKGRFQNLYTSVQIVDQDEEPVVGASVALTVAYPDGAAKVLSGTTGDDGSVTLSVRATETGEYTSTVTAVNHEAYLYDASADVETEESLLVP